MEHFHACFFSPIGAAAEFSPKNEATGMTPGGLAVLFGRFFPLLQVSSGCSYNKCAFCFVCDGASFCASPLDRLQKDLAEMGRLRGASMKSMGPLNGDPSGFPPRPAEIARTVHRLLSDLASFAGLASVRKVLQKSSRRLKGLVAPNYNDLSVGIEACAAAFRGEGTSTCRGEG